MIDDTYNPDAPLVGADPSTLRRIGDPDSLRSSIFESVSGAFGKRPLANDSVEIKFDNVRYNPSRKSRYSIADTKAAINSGKKLSRPLIADVSLLDRETGEILDRVEGHTIANVPYLTHRGSFIMSGTEYVPVNQLRLRPGIYTRRKDNGELEAHVNTAPGTGPSMRIFMDPESGIFKAGIGSASIRIYPVLRALGVDDADLKKAWGEKIWAANSEKVDARAFPKFYDKLVGDRRAPRILRDIALGKSAATSIKAPAVRPDFWRSKSRDLSIQYSLVEEPQSKAQAESGNYRHGHINLHGLPITIENAPGGKRKGYGPDGGVTWTTVMKDGYGYIKRSKSEADGDHIDVFIGPDIMSDSVYIIDQVGSGRLFDEHKCVLGATSAEQAKAIYLRNYEDGWGGFGGVTHLSMPQFKRWIRDGDTSVPAASMGEVKVAWVGVDLDGTLARSGGEFDPSQIGEPIPSVASLVKSLSKKGVGVKILTARAADKKNIPAVRSWLSANGFGNLEVTSEKDPGMDFIIDDKAVAVSKNKGLSPADKKRILAGARKEASAVYDWDNTMIPRVGGGASEYLDAIGRFGPADASPIARSASARGPVNIVTARPPMFHRAMRDAAGRMGIQVGSITHADGPKSPHVPEGGYLVDDDQGVVDEVIASLGEGSAVNSKSDLAMLLEAKAHSDAGNYRMKEMIVRGMMDASPGDWEIDSDDGDVYGLTHGPTKFRIHLKKRAIPMSFQGKLAEMAAGGGPEPPEDFDKGELVLHQLNRMEIDPEVTYRSLGVPYKNFGVSPIIDTTRKLLAVSLGEMETDDREDLAHKSVHSPDDFLAERITKDAGGLGRKLLWSATRTRDLSSLRPGYFTPQLESFVTNSSMSQAVTGINPVELDDISQKITQLGEGGISSADSVPESARDVHPTQLGIIDPVRTSESTAVGIDQRIASSARKSGNRLYFPLRDRASGEIIWLSPSQLHGKSIGFPALQ